jgi:head-tail adaptor
MPSNPAGGLTNGNGVGSLRWLVTLYRRIQSPGPSSGISEDFLPLATVHADIQPTYATTHYLSAQVDIPITHLIRLRWLDYVENVVVVMRSTTRPNDGTIRTELFRVRRVKEVGGRKRFCELECELESVKTTDGDSDAERESAFAENPQLPLH